MADVFYFYVYDDRKIEYTVAEPIMLEDNGVTDFRFRIPKTVNGIDVSNFAWWFVYVNAAKNKYSIPLTLTNDEDEPDRYMTATYTVDYGMTIEAGGVRFAIEAINANQSGEIVNEWHTRTYNLTVHDTLQGNQVEYAETESDIISALIVQIQQKYNALVGGATPIPVASVSAMTDTSKIYLLTTDKNWYYYNGSAWVSGGLYASGIVIDPTLTQSGQAADAKAVDDKIDELKSELDVYTGEYDGVINKSVLTKINGLWVNPQTGKTNSSYDSRMYSVYFPCLPNTKYNIYKAIGTGRFLACWTKVKPDYSIDTYGNITNNTGNLLSITTGADAKYVLVWYYYSGYETETESYFYNSISISGGICTAHDFSNASELTFAQLLTGGKYANAINHDTFKKLASAINSDTGGLNSSPSTTSLLIYFPCKASTRYAVSKKKDARFVVGWTTTEPDYGGSCGAFISSYESDTIEITTGASATHLCVFYYLSTACVNSESDLLNSIAVTEGSPDYVIVSKTGYYKTITSGVGAVKTGGSVIVMPGTYEEQIDAQTKEVNIIGTDKNKCILLDKTGMYLTPPLEISTGSVQNMTIIETGEQSTPSSQGSNPTLAYCIHVDFNSEEDGKLLISNCVLRCNKRAAIGSGVRNNFEFTIENCDIWSGVQEDTSNLARGALFVHAASSSLIPSGGYVPARLILKNNTINCDDVPAICFEDYSSTVGLGFVVEAIGNMVYSKLTGKTNACIVNTDPSTHEPMQFAFDSVITQDPRSFGNNVALLNAE